MYQHVCVSTCVYEDVGTCMRDLQLRMLLNCGVCYVVGMYQLVRVPTCEELYDRPAAARACC